MKQSVDLMNSMKRFSFRHSNVGFRHSNTGTYSTRRTYSTAPTSLARRAMLLVLMMVMSVGNVWGQTFNTTGTMVSGAIEKDEYLNVLSLRETNINIQSKESEIIAALNSFGSSYTSSDIADNVYIRWSILDGTNNVITNFAQNSTNQWGTDTNIGMSCSGADIKWSSEISGFYWFKELEPWSNPHSLNTKLSVSVGVHNSKTFADFSDYTIVCYITDDLTGTTIAPNSWTAGSLNTEPNFKVKYTFHFGVKVDTFVGHLKSGSPLSGGKVIGTADVLATSDVSATLDLTAALAEVSGAKYARFYLIKDGAAVDPTGKLTVTGGTAGPELEHGFYISKPAGLTVSDLSGITLSLTASEFEDYQIGCVFSTDEATALPTKEPDWDLQYTYTFEYPFKGDATSATEVEKAITMLSSEWSALSEAYLKFDLSNKKIKLTKSDGTVLGTVAAIDESDFTNFWNNYPSNTLGGTDNFYVRYVLVNKSTGIEQGFKDQTLGSTTSVGGINLYYPQKHKYGRVWSTKLDGSNKDLNKIMMVKLWPDGQFDWTDYDVVVYIGTSGDEKTSGSEVSMEPSALTMKYTIHFEDRAFPATNIATVTTINKNVLYDGTLKIEQYGNEAYKAVASDLGVTSDGLGNLYSRWYVTDMSGNILTDLKDWDFSATKTYNKNDSYGHYILGFESWNAGQYDPTFDFPSTYTDAQKDYTQYKFVCVLTLDRTGMEPSATPLTNEPATMQLKYVYSFLSPEDYYAAFPANNINTVKTIYKSALYTKVDDGGGNTIGGTITPSLFNNFSAILEDMGVNRTALKTNGYARWYVTDASGNILSDLNNWGFSAGKTYTKNPVFGHYVHTTELPDYGTDASGYDPTFTLPSTGYDYDNDYKNLRVVCVLTTDLTGKNLPDNEPSTMQVKYVYNLILTDTEYAALPFVHYKGESGRDWVVPDGSTGSQAQKIWNNSIGEAENFTGDIRQGVHTWEYDVYILPSETRTLVLPFERYTDTGNNMEPRAYIRWYDWKTDTKVVDKITDSSKKFTFAKVGTALSEADRGLFGLCLSGNPTHDNVGVTFTPDADFTESIDIACDVSKYSDGISTMGGTSYLIHEPTLSTRYIFHIHPASECATKLATSKTTLETAETAIKAGADNVAMHDLFVSKENTMFKLEEDLGKVVVSLGAGKNGSFALRFDKNSIANYIINTGTTESPIYQSADHVVWYAYFENDEGIWKKQIGNVETNRITSFTFDNFTSDTYANLKGEGSLSITDGKKFHVVGYAGIGNTFNDTYAPVVHYELHFIEAAPIPVTDLALATNLERTDAYMKYHYDLAGVVDFDGNPETNKNIAGHEAEYYSTTNWSDAPTSAVNNMTYVPFPWDDNQYGFSYPMLTSTIKNGNYTGVSPEHGDYIMLKSMNAPDISTHSNGSAYDYYWWKSDVLYDYTHTVTDNGKYGSFLYTDASNESRTIATIPFTADLCHGSSIYFTAAVANMTGNTVKPQLLIRIVGLKGSQRVGVVSFHTCDILSAGGADGKWNQIYGMSTIPVDFDDEITSFVAEVINYANDTNGADFAIDELKVFTNTSKVLLKQSGSTCENPTDGKLKVYMDAEGLQNVYGKSDTEQTIYWRICREEDGTVVTGLGMYPQYDGVGTLIPDNDPGNLHTYGMSKVKSNFDPTGDVKTEADRESDAYGWYKDADNTIYFQIANQNFPALEEGGHYYVSVYDPNLPFDASKESFWGGLHFGATSKCSIFSNFFIPRRQYVTYEGDGGTEGGELSIACGGAASVSNVQMILKVPDMNEATGFKTFTDLHYDFVFVPLSTWTSTTATFSHGGTDYKYYDLRTALADYRGVSSSYNNVIGLASGYSSVNSSYHNLLSSAIAEGILDLAYAEKFTHTFSSSDFTISCLPVEKEVTISTGSTGVCSPFEITFSLKGSSPELELGFSDVVYPPAYTKRVLRLGLEQMKDLRENGYKLHVPIRLFKDKDKTTTNTLSFTSEYLTISAVPSDPTITTTGANFAKIVNPTDASADPVVDADHMYLTLDFSGTNCAIDFHEGFEYEVSTSYFDSRDAGVSGRCEGDIYLVVKIVPEFVTWNPYAIDATYYNVNWNNDTNWQRSVRTELYKGAKSSATNTATAGHPDGYENNGEGGLASITSTPQTYVPMKFSYVTLPTGSRAPSLINMNITAYPGSDYTGGILLAGDLGTDRSPAVGTSDATENIKYDMLVRYSYEASDKQKQCQGHYKADGVTVIGKDDANIYDCEKFYGNICREIYFKPGAEMINQQRLTYQKAWVEKELDRNKWYLLSAPLKGTYAGDMYVPKANGLQDTEAFQPISFNTIAYSRADYPVYQRSWDHSQDGGKVYTETTDPRATEYTANLKFSGAVSSTFAQWTHTYNDMAVKYTDLQGFALRAHKKDGTTGEKALFRWPKADESYTYYNYNDAAGTVTAMTTKGTGVYGRFVTDDYDNKATMTTMPLDEANINTENEYYLVGNPYMSSLDMAAFFVKNTHLTGQYWTMDGDPATGLTTGQVKPMTSFFVKTTDRSKGVNFDNSMMIDGNAPIVTSPAPAMQAPGLVLTAENEQGSSKANVLVGEGQNVETLFDSNLEDVPMVYTVANGYAVSINQVKELNKPIAFGVNCSSQDKVEVTFSDIEQLTNDDVFVVDAVDGKTQQIFEGDSFTVQPNDYGRYFLVFANGTTGIETTLPKEDGTEGEKVIFDLQGRRVIYPGKGAYIVNGKKVLMK